MFLSELFLVAQLVAPAAAPAAPVEGHVDVDGIRIRYVEQGQGEPLVLLHGYCANADLWVAFGTLGALAEDFRVVAVDLRGHGGSAKPHDADAYGALMAEDVVAVLDALHIERAHVAGYSLGGMVALRLSTAHPERVASTVLGGSGWYRFEPPGEDVMDRLADSLESGGGLAPLMRALVPPGGEPPSDEQLAAVDRMALAGNDRAALAACARALRGLAVDEATLRAWKVPALAIVGGDDTLRGDVEALAAVRPDLEVVVVPGADHASCPLSPLFVETLRRFPREHPIEAPVPAGAR